MIELGKKQELTVIKRVEFGVYLGEQEDAESACCCRRSKCRRGRRLVRS